METNIHPMLIYVNKIFGQVEETASLWGWVSKEAPIIEGDKRGERVWGCLVVVMVGKKGRLKYEEIDSYERVMVERII